MKKKLVIVESPAKAKTIGRFLGRRYRIEASMGHLIDLPKSQFGINVEDGFEPKYITIRGKGKIMARLRDAAKKCSDVYLATDMDREGEAISWHLANALKIDSTKKCRIEFNEITQKAIKKAIQSPRSIDTNLVNAQQARRILDRLVGYRLSPLLWNKVKKGLSAGRVQSVALRIICEREKEIEDFVEEEYWSIQSLFKTESGEEFWAKLHRIDASEFTISNEEEAEDHKRVILESSPYKVDQVSKKERKKNPPPPFITSTLQQKASYELNFSAKKTMYLAQQLYEGLEVGNKKSSGLITYMRTDSTRVSNEALQDVRSYISKEIGEKFLPKKPRAFKSKKAQDAHEAIRPTDVNLHPHAIKEYLTTDQYRLYRLIWERFVASQMEAALYLQLRIDVLANQYLFRATGSKLLFPGYLKIMTTGKKKEDEDLPEVKKDALLTMQELEGEQHFTKPPPRYSEASLVKTLEDKGVGRPSTYAPTLATIQQRGYVIKEGKNLKPTELGTIVIHLLTEHFPDVTNVEFTARLEERLDSIEEGSDDWVKILSDFYYPFEERLKKAKEEMKDVEIEDEVTEETCEECGENLVIKHGRFGKFLACPGFPDCKFTKPLVKKIGVQCPECREGEMVQRRSRKGRVFYGCSSYPDCTFVSWSKPLKEECPECGSFMVEVRGKKIEEKRCSVKDCGYKV